MIKKRNRNRRNNSPILQTNDVELYEGHSCCHSSESKPFVICQNNFPAEKLQISNPQEAIRRTASPFLRNKTKKHLNISGGRQEKIG
jgi:hypothetical protein